MAKFAISIKETLEKTVIVEAEDVYEAESKVQDAIDRCDIILTADDFTERNIEASRSFLAYGLVPKGYDTSCFTHIE